MESASQGPAAPAEKATAELRKPHEMTVMVLTSGRMTATGRKIYEVMLHISQVRLDAMNAMPPADYMFEAPLAAMLRSSGASENDRTDAKRYLKEMRDFTVDWESTAPGDGVKWQGFSMLSEVIIELRNGENWVRWSFPPTIIAALRDPARWARLDLEVIARLSSYASIALYEICARYRDNPSGLTSRKSTTWWSDAISPTPAGTERREWRKLKNERVKKAVAEINAATDLEIELIEHKQGRAVVEVQFAIRKKKQVVVGRRAKGPVDAHLIRRGELLGIRAAKLEGLIEEFDEDLVREKVAVLESRVGNSKLSNVDNPYSYLRSLVRNHQQGDIAASDAQELDATGKDAQTAPPKPGEVPTPRLLPPEEEWVQQRRDEIRERIQALSPEQKRALIDEALSHLGRQGLLNAVVSRRAAQGDILHGMLGATVVRIYGEREYGPDWNKKAPEGDLFS